MYVYAYTLYIYITNDKKGAQSNILDNYCKHPVLNKPLFLGTPNRRREALFSSCSGAFLEGGGSLEGASVDSYELRRLCYHLGLSYRL